MTESFLWSPRHSLNNVVSNSIGFNQTHKTRFYLQYSLHHRCWLSDSRIYHFKFYLRIESQLTIRHLWIVCIPYGLIIWEWALVTKGNKTWGFKPSWLGLIATVRAQYTRLMCIIPNSCLHLPLSLEQSRQGQLVKKCCDHIWQTTFLF